MQGKISLRNVEVPSRVISRRPWYAIESGLAGLHECPVVQSGASKVAVSVRLKMLLFGRTAYACWRNQVNRVGCCGIDG